MSTTRPSTIRALGDSSVSSLQGLTLVHLSAQHWPLVVTDATSTVHFSAHPGTCFCRCNSPNSPRKVLT
jgi:hypothetical protein